LGDIKYFFIHITHNSSTTPLALALAYEMLFYETLHYALVLGLHFCVKKKSDLCQIFFF